MYIDRLDFDKTPNKWFRSLYKYELVAQYKQQIESYLSRF